MKAFLFPGQGSQKVGMGADLFDTYKRHVEIASDLLGYCLKTLCLEDPNGELGKTQYTQPALYVVSALAYLDRVGKENTKPDVLAGHSLGEYNALFAAGAFTFEAGLKLVQKRAELMSKSNGGSMVAVAGRTATEIKTLLSGEIFQGLDIASVNSSKQVVISGPPDLISTVVTHFESSDTQCYPLNVSAAFHSRYMKPAADEFFEYLRSFDFTPLQIPVISNVSARPYDEAESSHVLASQIHSCVKWEASIQYMMAMGVTTFLEVGPGSVLTNMQRNIAADPSLKLGDSGLETMSGFQPSDSVIVAKEEGTTNNTALKEVTTLVSSWNERYPIGTQIKLAGSGDIYKTTSEAMLLFDRRAVIYLQNKNGFFPLSDVNPLS